MNPEIYNPEGAVDNIAANGDTVVLMDAYSSNYATIMANGIFSYSPEITKSALGDGFKAVAAPAVNQTEDTNSGDVNHYAILDTSNSKVLVVCDGTGSTITAGAPFNVPSFDVSFPAPTVV